MNEIRGQWIDETSMYRRCSNCWNNVFKFENVAGMVPKNAVICRKYCPYCGSMNLDLPEKMKEIYEKAMDSYCSATGMSRGSVKLMEKKMDER